MESRRHLVEKLKLSEVRAASTLSQSVDVVVDCCGDPQGLEAGLKALTPGGPLLLVGCASENVMMQIDGFGSFLKETEIVGTRSNLFSWPETLEMANHMHQEGYIELEQLQIGKFLLNNFQEALEQLQDRKFTKVLVCPNDTYADEPNTNYS